jgi:hypothetical protein
MYDLPSSATVAFSDDVRRYEFAIAWLDNPANRSWRKGPDVRDRSRRSPTVWALINRFGDARRELIPSAWERRLGLVQRIGHAAAWAVRQRPDAP